MTATGKLPEETREINCTEELADILRQCGDEVDKWPDWQRSLDPLGESHE